MPELPEVETIRSQLDKYLVGHLIKAIEVLVAKMFVGDQKNVVGGKIVGLRRFGKVLVIDLDNGFSLLFHLKLTGQLVYQGSKLKKVQLSEKVGDHLPGKHTRIIFHLDKNGTLFFNDLRKFGWVKVVQTNKVEDFDFIKKLGPEPLDGLTLKKFKEIIHSSKRNIKVLLLDQSKISGVGNIYANDALWLAKISPKRNSQDLSEKEIKTLYQAIIKVLRNGLKYSGASDQHYVTAEGQEGQYQDHFLVYWQNGKTCSKCKKAKIEKIRIGGRGTYLCPNCQK